MPKRNASPSATERVVSLVLAGGLLLTAVIVSSGSDPFRLPKELVFRAEAVVLLALGIFWATAKQRTWRFAWRPEYVLTLAIAGWALITTATSTNRLLSADSLITVVAAAIIFLATSLAAQGTSLVAIDVLMIGCCVNAIIVILQELKVWTPLPAYPGAATHYGSVGLLGNANDVGTYLVAPAVAAFVLSVISAGKRRWIYASISVLLVGGIAASATRTAVASMTAGLIVFGLFHSRRTGVVVLIALIVFGLVVIALPSTTLGRGMRDIATAAAHGDMEQLFSQRLVPFLTAVDMTRDHPLTGVGPGCFKFHFMRYRVGLFDHYPERWTRGYPMNWGEVHNDHLQVAAETGLPGYALFLAAIALCAGWRARTVAMTTQAAFARALRWPLAAVIFTLCLAQFPLELAAPRLMLLTLGAIALSWDNDHVAA